MGLQAHSKTNCLKDIIWRYITKYSTQHFVLVFSASLVRLLLVSFCYCHLFPSWLVVFRREDSIGRRLQKSRSQSGLIHALCLHPLKSFFFVGLVLQGHLLLAVDFVSRHRDCLLDIALLSTVSFSFSFSFLSSSVQTITQYHVV